MTGDGGIAFETLIYTDCVPGQGLQGSAGLQFQARSAGADRAAESLVQQTALYEPPSRWMRERRPADRYPPSLAHTYDGLYVTAAGVYLGREANGGREGNQLTHAIVTADPESYLLHRPAQLFGAPFWVTGPAPTTECPPIRHPWEPGPFDIEAAQTFVTTETRGADLLEALLTCLLGIGEPGARRVLFRGEDAAAVLRWISAATLLVPHRQALRIGFKVFTTNPAYAAQPVVAVHPDWDSTSVTVGDDGGYAVFDLAAGGFSRIDVSDDARRRVRLLFDEDAYDVLDVVELAEASGRTDRAEAFELARAMVLPKRPLSADGARIAVSWLHDTPPELLAPSRGVLVDRLIGTVEAWPAEVLLALDELARSGQIDAGRVAAVRIALVRAEVERAARTGRAYDLVLPPLPGETWRTEGEHLVLETLRTCRDPRAVDAVLKVVGRFRLNPDLGRVPGAVEVLLAGWRTDPDGYSPYLWGPCGDPLLRELRAELRLQIAAGEGDAVGDRWRGRFTLKAPLGDDVLDAALLAAEMAYRDAPGRAALVREMLTAATAGALARTVGALWRRTEPAPDEYALLADLLPAGTRLPDWLVDPLVRRLTHEHLAVLRRLAERRLLPSAGVPPSGLASSGPASSGPASSGPASSGPTSTGPIDELLAGDERLRLITRGLPAADTSTIAEYAGQLACTPARAVHVWGGELIEAMRSARQPAGLAALAGVLPADLRERYLDALLGEVAKDGSPRSAAALFDVAGAGWLTVDGARECQVTLHRWIARSHERARLQATELIRRFATTARQREWDLMLADREARSWNPLRRRRADG
jgi:hypothetical protein